MLARLMHIPGRHVLLSDGAILWAWPGVYAESIFTGNSLSICYEGPGCAIRIRIDHQMVWEQTLPAGPQHWTWKGALGRHVLHIQTTHQDSDLPFTLHSIQCQGPVEAAPVRRRKIEFVGDSWTCGFGNLSSTDLISDCTQAYAALIAERLQADYSLVAVSGHGIVKNFGETPPSPQSLPIKYARAQSHIADTTPWRELSANIGVVFACENDFSFPPHPSQAEFIVSYQGLLQQMRSRHPGIQIFLVGIPRSHPGFACVKATFAAEQILQHSDIHWIEVCDLDPAYPLGYLWHPGLEHHRQLAQQISTAISAKGSL